MIDLNLTRLYSTARAYGYRDSLDYFVDHDRSDFGMTDSGAEEALTRAFGPLFVLVTDHVRAQMVAEYQSGYTSTAFIIQPLMGTLKGTA